MPIKIEITVNDEAVKTIQIARIKGRGLSPDSVATYSAVESTEETWLIDWEKSPALFTHRYGDGIERCVALGIEALYPQN